MSYESPFTNSVNSKQLLLLGDLVTLFNRSVSFFHDHRPPRQQTMFRNDKFLRGKEIPRESLHSLPFRRTRHTATVSMSIVNRQIVINRRNGTGIGYRLSSRPYLLVQTHLLTLSIVPSED